MCPIQECPYLLRADLTILDDPHSDNISQGIARAVPQLRRTVDAIDGNFGATIRAGLPG